MSILYLGVACLAMMTGKLIGVRTINEDLEIVFQVLAVVSFVLALGSWKIADTIKG